LVNNIADNVVQTDEQNELARERDFEERKTEKAVREYTCEILNRILRKVQSSQVKDLT